VLSWAPSLAHCFPLPTHSWETHILGFNYHYGLRIPGFIVLTLPCAICACTSDFSDVKMHTKHTNLG
jgi:hypothetical protein